MLKRIKELLGERTIQLDRVNQVIQDLEVELRSVGLTARVAFEASPNEVFVWQRGTSRKRGSYWGLFYIKGEPTQMEGATPLLAAPSLIRTRFLGVLPKFVEVIEERVELILEYNEEALNAAAAAKAEFLLTDEDAA
tara:strand:- start:193 stop:603 length:411 start_codon:yes stop_codon:yes gene_type:complete